MTDRSAAHRVTRTGGSPEDQIPDGPPAGLATGLSTALREIRGRLTDAGVPSPRADAALLAGHVLGLAPAEVTAAAVLGRRLTPAQARELAALTGSRVRRVPLQHLTGTAAFRTLELAVGPGVFIPRPETELTAHLAIAELRSRAPASALAVDLCTGSGAIALALATEVPRLTVYAVEVSEAALAYARANVDHARLADRVHLLGADARTALPELAPIQGRAHVVTCNPPYIPPDGVPVEPEVRDHDPELALYGGGPQGLDLPVALAARAMALLAPGGLLVMEHADGQYPALATVLSGQGWVDLADHRDLADRSRVVTARAPVGRSGGHPGEQGAPIPR